ncbi:MAG TPA: lipopolysaccharide assembly protein LapA domain-containing protein [Trebonia sp.]|jgi:uncharacterized integral membrane protein
MARWRRGTTEESATVPGQRTEPAPPPDAGADDPARGGADQGSTAVLGDPQTGAANDTVRDEENVQAAEQTRPDPPVPDEHAAVLTEDGPQTAARQPETEQQPTADRPAAEAPARAATPADHKIRHTRLSGTWMAVVLFAVILVLLLIFILQNGHTVDVSYMGAHGHLPLGVALLLAAVAGILLTAMAGSARIMQLRATARKHRKADVRAVKG